MNYVKLGDTIRASFGTADSTGEVSAADSTPVVVIRQSGVALAYVPVVTAVTTGLYEVAIVCSTANGFVNGGTCSAYVTVVLDGITGRDGLVSFNVASAMGTVWDAIIEEGYSAAELVRLLVAMSAGSATGLEGNEQEFMALDGTTVRVTGTVASGDRTSEIEDLT
jgi:hypothetical protein